MGLKPGHALQMSHVKPITRVLLNPFIVFTLKHRAHTLHSSAPPQSSQESWAGLPKKEQSGGYTSPSLDISASPVPLGSPSDSKAHQSWQQGPGCPWNRHN